MKIILDRYYGDRSVTKSTMAVVMADGTVGLECEAREPRFDRYREAFPGCSQSCLAEGRFTCKPRPSLWSPMTLTVLRSPGHWCCRFGWDELLPTRPNTVLVGVADGTEPPESRNIFSQRETFAHLTELVYRAYVTGEPMVLAVRNAC
mgnify:CR=1 FL=1